MIGGNVWGCLQVKDAGTKNAIGEAVHSWMDVTSVLGWLDFTGGESYYTNFNAKIQESTHIFMTDFQTFKNLSTRWVWNPFSFVNGVISDDPVNPAIVDATSENARFIINGLVYDILLIDDPMGMHEHLEIYLRFVGG